MLNKSGFTLIEMCLILFVVSMLLLMTPSLFHSTAILDFHCERLVAFIKQAQAQALLKRKEVNVEVERNGITIDHTYIPFAANVVCDEYFFYFNGRGNINMANTITCHYYDSQKQIVMNLGNGNVYVKR